METVKQPVPQPPAAGEGGGRTKVKVAIMSIALMTQGATMISPALSAFAAAFPDASTTAIQLLVTIPLLVSIPFMLVTGLLSRRISKKKMAAAGLLVFNLGGLLPLVLHDISLIMLCRMVSGIGIGMISPLSQALIGDNFQGPGITRMFGLNSVAMCVGSMLCSYLAGVFARISYNATFLCYAVGLLAFAAVLAFLPGDRPAGAPDGRTGRTGLGDYLSIPADLWLRYAFQLLFAIAYFTYFTNTSLLIESRGLGDTQFSGITTSLSHVAGILAGLILPMCSRLFKGTLLPVMLLCMLAGMVVELNAGAMLLIHLASFLIGFSYQIIMPYMIASLTQAAPNLNKTVTSSLFTMMISIGAASSAVVLGVGARALGLPELEGQLYLSTGVLALLIVGVLVYKWKHTADKQEVTS